MQPIGRLHNNFPLNIFKITHSKWQFKCNKIQTCKLSRSSRAWICACFFSCIASIFSCNFFSVSFENDSFKSTARWLTSCARSLLFNTGCRRDASNDYHATASQYKYTVLTFFINMGQFSMNSWEMERSWYSKPISTTHPMAVSNIYRRQNVGFLIWKNALGCFNVHQKIIKAQTYDFKTPTRSDRFDTDIT